MRQLILGLFLVLAGLHAPGAAQQATPIDAEARAAFDRMAASLWRPRDHGLEEVRFEFSVEVIHPDRPIEWHGPFRIHWQKGLAWTLLDAEGKPDPAPEKRMSVGFADRAVNDFVGWEAAEMIAGRKLSMLEKGLLQVEIPGAANPDELRVERILLELDADGSLARQSLVGTGGILLTRLEYDYLDRAGRRLVAKVRRESASARVVKKESYQDCGDFCFPAEIRSLSADRRVEIVRYTAIEVLKPLPDKK